MAPATCYVDVEGGLEAMLENIPDGWRVIVGLRSRAEVKRVALTLEVLELPSVESRQDDVPAMIAAWVERLSPGTTVSPEALSRLSVVALERGLACLGKALDRSLAVARGALTEECLPPEASADVVLEKVLAAERPLAEAERRVLRETLERCCWRIQDAADRLGVSRVTLWRKLRDHGIARQGD